jgi:phospholipid/cholesterol/gamma-HCH transport system substrate-binding protein
MKKTRKNEILAGIFLVVAVLLSVAFYLKVSGTLDMLARETYQVRVRFERVLGITPSTKVTLNGVDVGRVSRIYTLAENEKDARGANVEMVLNLDRNLAVLYPDAEAELTSASMLSEKQVDLSPGTAESGERLKEGDLFYGSSGADLNAILARAESVVAGIEEFLQDARLKENIMTIVEDARSLVENLNDLSVQARELVKEQRPKIDKIFDNVQVASDKFPGITDDVKVTIAQLQKSVESVQEDVEKLLGSADQMINENRPNVKEITNEVRRTAASINKRIDPILKNVNELSGHLNETVGDNREEIDRIIRKIEKTAANLSILTEELAGNPWQLIYPQEKRRQTDTLYPAWRSAPESVEPATKE